MPRKKSDENLTKVISSIISVEDFEILEKYTKVYYARNLLKLPTTSHMLRYMLSKWAAGMRKKEQEDARNSKLNQPERNNRSTTRNVNLDHVYLDHLLKKR